MIKEIRPIGTYGDLFSNLIQAMGSVQCYRDRPSRCQIKNAHLNTLMLEQRTHNSDQLEFLPGVLEMIDLVRSELSPCK